MLLRIFFTAGFLPYFLAAAPDATTAPASTGNEAVETIEAEATMPAEAEEGPFESLIKKCDTWKFPEDNFKAQPDGSKVYLKADKVGDGPFKDQNLTQFATVWGIRIIADEGVDSKKLLHVANAMAKLIDSDADGNPDSDALLEELIEFHSTLFIMKDSDRIMTLMNAQNADEGFPLELKFCPFAFDFEEQGKINPGGGHGDATCEPKEGAEVQNDRTIAFVLDHLMGRGFGAVMGEDREKKLQTIYKESLEAGTFDPENTGCPPESDECGRVMFASWGMSTLLGFDTCWCEQAHALKFCDKKSLVSGEPELVELLSGVFPDIAMMDDSAYNPKDKSRLVK